MTNLSDLLLGGPGLRAYAHTWDILCVECGQHVIAKMFERGAYAEGDTGDSDTFPQPIFFPESDNREHCVDCGEYCYGHIPEGTDENEDEDEESDNE